MRSGKTLIGSWLSRLVEDLRLVPPGGYYAILFVAFVAEGTSFPLIHVPAAVMFLASAYLVSAGKISLLAAILVATAGSTAGGYITYLLGGRMAGPDQSGAPGTAPVRLPGFLGHWAAPERLEKVQRFAARYGAFLALAARWLGILRPAALLGTGMARIRPWKVVPALFIGSLAYCTFYQLLAEGVAGVSLRLLGRIDVEWLIVPILGLALTWLAGVYILRRIRL